jgi:N-acyl-D-amino-acid deacylase
MMEFVKKATLMPSEFFGLKSKGWIGEGADADIVVFDPKIVKDNAAFPGMGDPMAAPDGIEYVFVNGVPVIRNSELVIDARPGRAISSETVLWRM